MKTILICLPKYGKFEDAFVNLLCQLLTKNIGYKFEFFYTQATYVEQARDELAMMAIQGGFERTLWIDLDMGHRDPQIALACTQRLLSHDVPVICGQYTTHTVKANFIGQQISGEVPDANGLLKMDLAPIGFAAIKTEVFKRIQEITPWAAYTQRNPTQQPKQLHQFFRNGLVGKNTAESKLARIAQAETIGDVKAIVADDDYSDQTWMGEDFDFCRRVRAAGYDILMDTHLIIPHGTYIGLPIANSDVYAMLAERWRNHDIAKLKSIIANLEFGESK